MRQTQDGQQQCERRVLRQAELPRHATADAMTDLLMAEFEVAAMEKMSTDSRKRAMSGEITVMRLA